MNSNDLDDSRYFWQGDRVRLRPLRPDDAERLFAESLDSPSRQVLQLEIELPSSIEAKRAEIDQYAGCKETNGVILFAVEAVGGEAVGGISLHSQDHKNGVFSAGLIISRPYWGRSYGADALRILLRYAFWERRFQKCDSACVATNQASIALHRKLGFVEEGRRRCRWFLNGEHVDEILFGLTREEFDAVEESL